jgi:hypothetical protein
MSSVSHTAANVVSHTDAVSVVLVADLAGCAPERSSGLLRSSPILDRVYRDSLARVPSR